MQLNYAGTWEIVSLLIIFFQTILGKLLTSGPTCKFDLVVVKPFKGALVWARFWTTRLSLHITLHKLQCWFLQLLKSIRCQRQLWLLSIPRNLAVVVDYSKFEPFIRVFRYAEFIMWALFLAIFALSGVLGIFCLNTWLFLLVSQSTHIFWVKPRQSDFREYTPHVVTGS